MERVLDDGEIKSRRVFLDSDIFIRDLRFSGDKHYEENLSLIQLIKEGGTDGYTSIYNLLEVCGYLSFNLNTEELRNLYTGFSSKYSVKMLFPETISEQELKFNIPRVFSYMEKKMALSDSIISDVADIHGDLLDYFITWNAKHFKGKLSIQVIDPQGFLVKYKQ